MIWNNEVFSHLLVTFIYFFLVSVLRWKLDWGLWGLWSGALLGTFFLDIDHLVYWFVTNTEKEDSKEAKEIVGGFGEIRDIRGIGKKLYILLQKVHFSHTSLIFHSVIGQVILFILAIYVLTSGGSVFGSGFIMAVNLHLLKDEWTDFIKDKDHLRNWLFWQIREPRAGEFLREYLIIISLLFLVLTKLLI